MSGAIETGQVDSTRFEDAWAAVQSGLHYVSWLAREFLYSGVAREDLEAEGRIGLFEAALRFDTSRGAQFLTYASFWSRRRMQTFVARHGSVVRRPASRIGTPRSRDEVSLDQPVSPGSLLLWRDVLVDRDAPRALDSMVGAENAALIASAAHDLPPQWRKIIVRRFGLDGRAPMTLAAVGDTLGLSRERVRQIEAKAMERLRTRLEAAWGRARNENHSHGAMTSATAASRRRKRETVLRSA